MFGADGDAIHYQTDITSRPSSDMAIRHTAYGCQRRRHRWSTDVPGYAVVLLNNDRLDEDHRGEGYSIASFPRGRQPPKRPQAGVFRMGTLPRSAGSLPLNKICRMSIHLYM